ncbi:MAG: polysaccharide biosynthesis protein [Bacilli bacterium]|nr:polysaccharide biosynthesis protein [Bacilli bacterium]
MKKSSFIEGTFIATFAIVLTKILGMLYVIPFYKIVGSQGGALYAYAYTIYVLFIDISTAGIPNAISKITKEYNTLGKEEAKVRAFKLGIKLISIIAIISFLVLFIFAEQIGMILLEDITGGNTIKDVALVIRCVSFAILVIPFLSVSRGFLQGHSVINVSSFSQVIEQIFRIAVVLGGSYLTLNILGLSLTTAVGVAMFGAFAGGIASVIYIGTNIIKNKKELSLDTKFEREDAVTNKEIIKKIITYAIPVIIVSVAVSIYNIIDMLIILNTISKLGFTGPETEFIASAINTWSSKINMIVTSVGTGMTASLIPTIVKAYTLGDYNDVNNKCNKALQIIILICLPMVVGISLLAKPIWTIFYGYNSIGVTILSLNIFVALFLNLFMVTNFTLQSVNKFKVVYISALTGFILNALLDAPLMIIFSKIGIPAYLGATVATLIGYTASVLIALLTLKKQHNFKYMETIKVLFKTLLAIIIMAAVVILLKSIIPVNLSSTMSIIIYIGVIALFGALVYLFVIWKLNLINDVLGKEYVKKIIKKLTFGKVS